MPSRTVILVPRRPDNGRRDLLWRYCRPHWENLGFDIVEGDDLEGAFSRSAALNTASSLAGDWDTAILLDSDVLVDLATVQAAIELSDRVGRVVLPFREWKGLNLGMTDKIMKGFAGNWDRGVRDRYLTNISACVVVPRSIWDLTGGFDERFQGWGWEDSAWMWAVNCLDGPHLRFKGDLWHLWHDKAPEKNTRSSLWRANKALAMRYQSAQHDPDAMVAILSEPGGPLA